MVQIRKNVCDRCQKVVTPEDVVEWQEWFHWSTTGGFGSAFGDGTEVEIDLCQACTKLVLGPFARVTETDRLG